MQSSTLTGMSYLEERARTLLCRRDTQHLLRSLPRCHPILPKTSISTYIPNTPSEWITWSEKQAEVLAQKLKNITSIPYPFHFNTNDYLGIQRSGITISIDQSIASMLPVGGLSSRLVGGNHYVHEALEQSFAHSLGFESALLFTSGTNANHALATTLALLQTSNNHQHVTSSPVFFSDQLNHASMIEGMRASRIQKRVIYPHLNMCNLYKLIQEHKSQCSIVWSESVYSMDGDGPSAKDLLTLVRKGAVIILDEAHALGVYDADHGKGLAHSVISQLSPTQIPKSKLPIIGVYPCGKSLATAGALVCGPQYLIDLLINTASQWIYSTATSPLITASTLVRFLALPYLNHLRKRIQEISCYLADNLASDNFHITGRKSPLLGIIVGSPSRALRMSQQLQIHHKISTTAIRYPTVPKNTSRIRLSLHPYINKAQCDQLMQAIHKEAKTM